MVKHTPYLLPGSCATWDKLANQLPGRRLGAARACRYPERMATAVVSGRVRFQNGAEGS